MMNNKIFGHIVYIVGLICLIAVVSISLVKEGDTFSDYTIAAAIGVFMIVIGHVISSGQLFSELSYKGMGLKFMTSPTTETQKRELEPEILVQRQNFSEHIRSEIPGQAAPEFHVLEEKLAFEVTPCSDPMTPMYTLDSNFRIIEWNNAFSACFDRTMEGRRGLNVALLG